MVESLLPSLLFLSTLPARGATWVHDLDKREGQFLSTLPARGATSAKPEIYLKSGISIHAPREGSDRGTAIRASANTLFLSTLPARGAT